MEDYFFKIRRRNMRIILVLSIIGSGFSMLGYLMMGAMMPIVKTMYESGQLVYPSEATVMIEQMLETPRSFFLWGALLYAISLVGVILMWNLRKTGFHLYTLSQLLVMLVTVLFLGKDHLPLGDVMLTILFVVYYYFALRNLEVFRRDNNEDSDNETSNSQEHSEETNDTEG